MTPNYQFKVSEARKMTDAQLERALKVNRVYATKAAEDCRENVGIYERELAWRRQQDGPFR